eukprot:181788-Hanusia_phi.AAC.7
MEKMIMKGMSLQKFSTAQTDCATIMSWFAPCTTAALTANERCRVVSLESKGMPCTASLACSHNPVETMQAHHASSGSHEVYSKGGCEQGTTQAERFMALA